MLAGFVPKPAIYAQQGSYAPVVREVARSGNSATLEITFPDPQLDTIKEGIRLRPYLGLNDETGEFTIPVAMPKGQVSVLKQETKDLFVAGRIVTVRSEYEAFDKGQTLKIEAQPGLELGHARLEYIGKVSRADASRIRIGAVAIDNQSSKIRYLKRMTLKVSAPSLPMGKLSDVSAAIKLAERTRIRPGMGKSTNLLQGAAVQQGIISDDGKVHKLIIDKDGLYKLTYDDLRKYGLNPDEIDVSTLRIVHNGAQVPIYVFEKQDGKLNSGDYIEFWGERKILNYESKFGDMYFDPYTRESIYYLVWGRKHSPIQYSEIKRLVEESGEVRIGDPTKYVDLKDSSFPSKIHIEEDNRYEYLSQTDLNELSTLRDHWYTAEIRRGGSFEISVDAPHPDIRKNSPLDIRIGLHGFSTFDRGAVDNAGRDVPDVPNEQEASISLNGSLILWDTWDSQRLKFITTDSSQHLVGGLVPTTQLLRAYDVRTQWAMTFMVQHTKATDVQSRFGLNWIDVTYDRKYSAWNNELRFRVPRDSRDGFYQFTLGGFSRTDISIYRKGVSKISNVFISALTPGAQSIQCIFQAPVSGTSEEFIALSDSAKLKPKAYMADDFIDLRNQQNEGEYVIITSRDLLRKNDYGVNSSILMRYVGRANRKGWKTKLVDVANIYDEFNFGAKSTEAIRNFLTYAYNNWSVPPKHVVLVGRQEQVPTPYIQSFRLGSISSDAWYSMIDGDDLLPDIIVGRVTAKDHAEAEAYINKVEKYESDPSASAMWKNQSLYISGNFALGSDFPSQITDLLNSSVPRNVFAERAGLNNDLPYYTGHEEVIQRFNQGLNYVHFMGHGGHRAWDDYVDAEGRAILVQDDVPLMTNPGGSFPFVTSLTCFTGSFEGEEPGLIPLLVNRDGGGAIGGYATSSFGFRDADYRIAESLLPSVYDSLPATWGERIFRAKTDYYLKHGGFGMLVPQTLQYAYYYIGDPSVAPYSPTQDAGVKLSARAASPGSNVTIEGTSSIQTGTARIDLATEGNSPLPNGEHVIDNIPVVDGRFSVTDQIPSNVGSPAGSYRVTIAAEDKSYARASADISFAKDRITEVSVAPRYVIPNANYSISAAVQTAKNVSSVLAQVDRYVTDPEGIEALAGSDNVTLSRVGDKFVGNASAPAASTRLAITVQAILAGGAVLTSDTLAAIVGGSSDPALLSQSNTNAFTAKLAATPTGLAWQQRVHNRGSVDATRPRVELLGTTKGVTSLLGAVTIPSIPAHSFFDVLLPYSSATLDSAMLRMRVVADTANVPYNYIDSASTNNETQLKASTLGVGAYLQGVGTTISGQHSALRFDDGFLTLDLGPSALRDVAATSIRVERVYQPLRNIQPDVQLIELDSIAKLKTYAVRVSTDSLGAPALDPAASSRTVAIAVKDNRTDLAIYRQDDRSKLWSILPTTRNGNVLSATISHLGTFAVGYHTDKTPPVVEMTVEGQVFVDKGDVPEKPRLSVVIQDANGIDVTAGKTTAKIDGQPIQAEITSSLDTQRTQTTINMRLEPTLSNGRHTIAVLAVDNNGLQTEKQLEVNVSNDFKINELGVYPNPFATVMFIAYEIKGIPFADEVELNIYTVSGKLIKTHRFPSDHPEHTFGFVKGGTGTPTSLGYHEVWWDGRDNDGIDVANGVYYYRLKVKTSRETKEITGKIARIR